MFQNEKQSYGLTKCHNELVQKVPESGLKGNLGLFSQRTKTTFHINFQKEKKFHEHLDKKIQGSGWGMSKPFMPKILLK